MNAATHALGLVLAIIGALVMAGSVAAGGDMWRTIGCGVYLASLIIVYAMSTLSHMVVTPRVEVAVPPTRPRLHLSPDRRDLHSIFAGVLAKRRVVGCCLAAMWCIAIVGFVAKVFFGHRVEAIVGRLYLLLGWMPIIAAPDADPHYAVRRTWWMVGGGAVLHAGHALPD